MTQNINIQQLVQTANTAIAEARHARREAAAIAEQTAARYAGLEKGFQALETGLKAVTMSRGGANPSLQYVENIPGRRVPFDFLVDIAIGANVNSVQQGTLTVPQDGPIVAVGRYAILQSQYAFQYTDPDSGAQASFQGRSFGRYRPIHSAWDLNDGMQRSDVVQNVAFPGNAAPHMLSPSNGSPFRSMQGDFRIKFENAGASFPRSNQEVPSAFWVRQINDPFNFGALDVFERGEVLTWKVLPTHVNNPSFGNISGFGAVNSNYPFLASQFDYIEGVNDLEDADADSTDPVVRVPNAILTIGIFGYIIRQPAGLSGGL